MKTYQDLAGDIRNLRYGSPGNLEFDYLGNVITIREPRDVLLVN